METVMISNYKLHCKACNKTINRGDLITRSWHCDGMYLRTISHKSGSFYTRNTGNYIFHRDCYMEGVWTDYSAEQEALKYNNDEYYY